MREELAPSYAIDSYSSLNTSDYVDLRVAGCHIPPLGDAQLIALIRATNDNDVDNGLSSWIGRCCKRKRVQAQENPEVSIFNRMA
ncbi:hypothetical protein BJV74DRAFT_166851 [Russula compacta]|nr:hypothetical protein BJV74DRAFT_166851 [Russula compacta]